MIAAPSAERLVELLTRITETPAPTFAEGPRAELVAGLLTAAGVEVERDEIGNVVGTLSGDPPSGGPPSGDPPTIAVAAHLDTVFPADTDVTVRREAGRMMAPGIGDNSASLAVLVHWVERVLAGARGAPHPRLIVAATVGEEGLGDLRGARRLVAEREIDAFVALDGHLGTVVGHAVGSKRYEVEIRAQGGHSWGDYPAPSAVHAAGDMIHAIARISVPSEPRSSMNVGQVSGGRSVNAIAERAWFNLDVRSLSADELDRLVQEARTRVRRVERAHGVTVEWTQVGDRPTAAVDNEALVRVARSALEGVGEPARVVASSTDANAAMAAGVPAIGFGVYRGGDAHRTSEWLDPTSLPVGFEAFARLMASLTGSTVGG